MEECTCSNLVERVGCILSYKGSYEDIAINYGLLTLSLYGAWWQRDRQRASSYQPLNHEGPPQGQQPQDNPHEVRPSRTAAANSLAFTVAYQIGLCVGLKCSGISVVWCATAGWIICQCRSSNYPCYKDWRVIFPLGLDAIGIVYYAVVTEPITTVAHFCALGMGGALQWISSRRRN